MNVMETPHMLALALDNCKERMSVDCEMSGGARTCSPALPNSQKTYSGAAKSDLTQEEFPKAIFNVSFPHDV